jgi:hypothetical protein
LQFCADVDEEIANQLIVRFNSKELNKEFFKLKDQKLQNLLDTARAHERFEHQQNIVDKQEEVNYIKVRNNYNNKKKRM